MNKFKKYFELESASLIAVGLGQFCTIERADAELGENNKYKMILGIQDDLVRNQKINAEFDAPWDYEDDSYEDYESMTKARAELLEMRISTNKHLNYQNIQAAKDIYEGLKDLSLDNASTYKMKLDDYGNEVIHRDGLKKFFLENGEPEIADKFKVAGVLEDKEEQSSSQKDYDTLLKIAVALAASNSEICPDGKPMSIKNGIDAIKRLYDKETNGESVHGLGTIKGGPANDIMRSLRELKKQ